MAGKRLTSLLLKLALLVWMQAGLHRLIRNEMKYHHIYEYYISEKKSENTLQISITKSANIEQSWKLKTLKLVKLYYPKLYFLRPKFVIRFWISGSFLNCLLWSTIYNNWEKNKNTLQIATTKSENWAVTKIENSKALFGTYEKERKEKLKKNIPPLVRFTKKVGEKLGNQGLSTVHFFFTFSSFFSLPFSFPPNVPLKTSQMRKIYSRKSRK